jgi:hypothetical protein
MMHVDMALLLGGAGSGAFLVLAVAERRVRSLSVRAHRITYHPVIPAKAGIQYSLNTQHLASR